MPEIIEGGGRKKQKADLRGGYTATGTRYKFGREQWRVLLRRSGKNTRIEDMVESIQWTEPADSAITRGSITFREPGYRRRPFNIGAGHEIILLCSVLGNGRFVELWRMRIYDPNHEISSGTRTFSLANDLQRLALSEDDFKYRKGKKKPRGWLVHEVIRDVCRRYRVRIGQITATRHRIKNRTWHEVDPLTVLNDVLRAERVNTGRRLMIRMTRGRLTVIPRKRSAELLLLGPTIIEAALRQSMREGFATALTVRGKTTTLRGRDQKDSHHRHRHRKINVKVLNAAAINRYGFIHRIVYAPDADSPAEARTLGRRYMARKARPIRDLTISHPGIPTLRKGVSIRVTLPQAGLKQIIFVSEITHNLSRADYTMDVTLGFDDPYVDEKPLRVFESLDDVAVRRGRPSPKKKKPKPKLKTDRQKQKSDTGPSPPSLGGVATPVK
jgi:hypothetical protein